MIESVTASVASIRRRQMRADDQAPRALNSFVQRQSGLSFQGRSNHLPFSELLLFGQRPIVILDHDHLEGFLAQSVMVVGRKVENAGLADEILFGFQVISHFGFIRANGFESIGQQVHGVPCVRQAGTPGRLPVYRPPPCSKT